MQAQSYGKIIFHVVRCARHGKCQCDSEGGCCKTFLDKMFDKHVKNPEDNTEGLRAVPSQKVQNGKLINLAEICTKCLRNKDFVHGATSSTARKKMETE